MTIQSRKNETPVTYQPANLKTLTDGAAFGLRQTVWHYTTSHRQDQVRHERYFFSCENIRPGHFIIVRSSPANEEQSTSILILGDRDYLEGYCNIFYLIPPTASRDINGKPPAIMTRPPQNRAA